VLQFVLLPVLLSSVVFGEPQQYLTFARKDTALQFALHSAPKIAPSGPHREQLGAHLSNAAIVEPEPRFALDRQVCSVLCVPSRNPLRSARWMLSRHKQLQQGWHYARGPPKE
jgi:hypothetical protein